MKNTFAPLCALLLHVVVALLPLPGIAAQLPITISMQVANESCPGTADGSITAIPSGGIGTYSYLWSTGDQVQQITGLTAGTYSVTVTDQQGGIATATATVGVNNPAPLATAGNDTAICATSIQLNGVTGPGSTGQWINLGSQGSIVNPMAAQTSVNGMLPGENLFAWVATNGQCTNADTITVRVSAATRVRAGEDTLLCGTSLDLRGSHPGTGTGAWSSAGPSIGFQNPNQFATTVFGLVPGVVYTAVWTVTDGSCIGSDSITIEVQDVPTAMFTFNGAGQTVAFTQSANLATTWWWDFGDGDSSFAANPTHTFAQPGNYLVCLTVTNVCGSDTLCRELTVFPLSAASAASAGLQLFPQPAEAEVRVHVAGWPGDRVQLGVFSLTGSRLHTTELRLQQGAGEASLPVSAMAPGIYLLKADAEGHTATTRLVIAH